MTYGSNRSQERKNALGSRRIGRKIEYRTHASFSSISAGAAFRARLASLTERGGGRSTSAPSEPGTRTMVDVPTAALRSSSTVRAIFASRRRLSADFCREVRKVAVVGKGSCLAAVFALGGGASPLLFDSIGTWRADIS